MDASVDGEPLSETLSLTFAVGPDGVRAELRSRYGHGPHDPHEVVDGRYAVAATEDEARRRATERYEGERRQYRELVDTFVEACRSNIAAHRVREGVWSHHADGRLEDQQINALLDRLDPADRETLAQLLERSFSGGVHQVLVDLYEHGVRPFDEGYVGDPFHDFIGRLEDPEWPWPATDHG